MSVSKRVITVPERHASTVAAIAARVAERMPKVVEVAAALTPPTIRAGGSSDGHGKGGHADPVAGIVLHNVGGIDDEENPDAKDRQAFGDIAEAVTACMEQLKWIEERQKAYLHQHPSMRAQRTDDLKSLCTVGGCDFRAERAGLCWKHYREELAAKALHTPEQPVCDTSTPGCGITANISPASPASPMRVEAECGRCGWTSPARDTDAAKAVLEHHHVTDCPAREATA